MFVNKNGLGRFPEFRDQGVGGSNPLSPTKFFKIKYLQVLEIRFRRLFHWPPGSIPQVVGCL